MDRMLTVRLDAAVADALEREARRTNRPKGGIVRDALAEHLKGTRPNALQALAKYAGCMTGPRDLSTNKRRLARLGRSRRS
jgi:hypothetical protein